MTARRIIFLALFAAAAARLMYSGLRIYLFIVLIMSAVLIIGMVNIIMTICLVRIRQALQENTCERGETVAVKIQITCPAFFQPAYILVHYRDVEDILNGRSQPMDISFAGQHANTLTFPVFCKYRGVYEVGVHKLEIRDLFGLIRVRLPKSALLKTEPSPLTVLPAADIPAKVSFDEDFSDAESTLHSWIDDVSSIAQVRDWRAGDSLKRVHWKLSARFGTAQIKEFDKIASYSVTIYADFSAHSLEAEAAAEFEDRLTSTAASCCKSTLLHGGTLRLIGNNTGSVRLENITPDHFGHFLNTLANIRFDGTRDFTDTIASDFLTGGGSGGAVIITASPSDRLFEFLTSGDIQRGRVLVCFVTRVPLQDGGDSPSASFLKKLRASDIPAFVISGGISPEVADA